MCSNTYVCEVSPPLPYLVVYIRNWYQHLATNYYNDKII